MRKSKIRKAPESTLGNIDRQSRVALDLTTAEPDLLRDSVRNVLSRLSEEGRHDVHEKLVAALKEAGVNLGQHLLLLGIPARTADELTAPEIAKVIRYVRINEPRAMRALVPILSELLTMHVESAQGVKVLSRAA
jgi:hypothetical protein